MSRLDPITDQRLAALIHEELNQCQNWAGSELRQAIRESLDYFLRRPKGDEVPGRSQVQSGDVADIVDHVQAEMQPMYAVPDLWVIEEEGPDDEEEAAVQTQALNWYWTQRSRGFEIIDQAVQDGLLSRNGYVKVWYEESYGLPYEQELEGSQLEIDTSLVQLNEENMVEVLDTVQVAGALFETVPVQDPMTGEVFNQAVELQPDIYRVTLKVTPILREVKAEPVASEDMWISRDAKTSNMQQPRFVAHRRRMPKMDAKALGLDPDEIDQVPITTIWDTDVKIARQSDYNTYQRHAPDDSGSLIDLFEVYYRIDADRDGIPEMVKCFYGGQKVLHWAPAEGEDVGQSTVELVRSRPFASGSPLRVAHRHQGRSLWDKSRDIEDIKRTLKRQMLDNLYTANDVTLAIGPTVDEDDVEETEIGKFIRAQNPQTDIREIKWNAITSDSLSGLAYMDRWRDETVGGSVSQSNANVPVNQAAHTTERVMSAMEKVVGMYARNFAHTLIRDIGVLLHQQLQLLPGKLEFQADGEWKAIEPRLWVQRNRLTVTMGRSEGEKMRHTMALDRVIDTQQQDLQTAAILVNPKALYEARVDRARSQGLDNAEQYWVDPDSPEGQIAAQAQARAAEAMRDQQQQMVMAQQAAAMRIAEMQEMTKRMEAQADSIEQQRDRVAKMIEAGQKLSAQYAKMALEYGIEVPGLSDALEEGVEMIEEGEIVEVRH